MTRGGVWDDRTRQEKKGNDTRDECVRYFKVRMMLSRNKTKGDFLLQDDNNL